MRPANRRHASPAASAAVATLLAGLCLLLLPPAALPAAAQPAPTPPAATPCPDADPERAVVLSMVNDELEELETSREVVVVRLGSTDEEPLERCAELDLWDELRCPSGAVTVELRCPGGSRLTLSEAFRVTLVEPEDGQDCRLDLRSGAGGSESDAGTGMQAGPVGAAAPRTRYEVRFAGRGGGTTQEVTVFDGAVEVRARGMDEAQRIEAGRKMVHRRMEWDFMDLDRRDVLRAARVSARVAAGSAAARQPDVERRAVYDRFVDLYQKTLVRPDDPAARLALADAQLEYRLADEALVQLGKADALQPQEQELKARIPLARSEAYELLGDQDKAQLYLQRAREIDPEVLRPVTRPDLQIHTPYPAHPHELKIQGSARTGRNGALVVVKVTDGAGRPVEGAKVEIRAGGGRFSASGSSRLRGSTDDGGAFTAKWTCSPCAAAYVLDLTASRSGYRDATGRVRIEPGDGR